MPREWITDIAGSAVAIEITGLLVTHTVFPIALRRLIDGGLPLADSPQLRRQAHGIADPGPIDSAALVEALAGHAENVAWGFTGSGMQAFGLHTQIALITPAMLEAVRTPGVTALIAPNVT
jgi:hypothetical protein